MKKLFIPMSIGLAAVLLAGCAVDLSLGGGKKDSTTTNNTTSNTTMSNNPRPEVVDQTPPTIGQQLIDLKEARDDSAITEAEYEAGKRSC